MIIVYLIYPNTLFLLLRSPTFGEFQAFGMGPRVQSSRVDEQR